MKKRLAKKIEKMRRKKIHEALEMVLEINTTQARSQRLTGRKPTAFFEFNGHINGCLDIRVYPDGWHPGCCKHWTFSTNYMGCSTDRLLEELANKKKELQDAGKM